MKKKERSQALKKGGGARRGKKKIRFFGVFLKKELRGEGGKFLMRKTREGSNLPDDQLVGVSSYGGNF